jgi:hypothetical protein
MKVNFVLLSLFLATAIPACAQQPSPTPQQKTVTGCLSGYRNRYTIGTSKDNLYLLEGDSAMFKKYNGARVEATGTLLPAKKGRSNQDALDYQLPTLKVTGLKKLDSTCGL